MNTLALIVGLLAVTPSDVVEVRAELTASGEVDVAALVRDLARATGVEVPLPARPLVIPALGRSRSMVERWLSEAGGPDLSVRFDADAVVLSIPSKAVGPDRRSDWQARLAALAGRVDREARRRASYGFRVRPSYRPDDPGRPTICLIHGMNSTAGVFRHLFEPLEAAGYGIVSYEFPYNQDLDDTSAAFARDWEQFRRRRKDGSRWALVAHSMGSLLARSLVEGDVDRSGEVSSLLLIAPPNHGSDLARGQTILQLVQSARAAQGSNRPDPLAFLGDGIGEAADDLTPGSRYLDGLNARPRAAGVAYRILAGDVGYLDRSARERVESRLAGAGRIGLLARFVAAETRGALDEITDGLGDGCVAVSSTRLDGAPPPVVLHLNHLELIRAPLLFPDPGPVASMPTLLGWLAEVQPSPTNRR